MGIMSEDQARTHVGILMKQIRSSNAVIGHSTDMFALASAFGRMKREHHRREAPGANKISEHDRNVASMVAASTATGSAREDMLRGLARCFSISYNFPPTRGED